MSLIHRRRSAMTLIPTFRQQKSLFTHSQRACYRALVRAVGPKPVVLARVNLADLVQHPGHDAKYRAHWDLIRRHRVDFVVCSPNSVRPVIAIELRTQLDKRRREHGLDVVAHTLAGTRIRLIRLSAADNYDYVEMRRQIRRALENENRNVVGPTDKGAGHAKNIDEDTADSTGGQRQDPHDIGVNWSTWSGETIQRKARVQPAPVDESPTRPEPDGADRDQVVVRRGSSFTLPS